MCGTRRFIFRSDQRVRDASGMGKIVDPGVGRVRYRSVYGVSDRHVGAHTEFTVSERRPIERFQRHRVERVHGTGQRQKSDCAKPGLFG